MQRNIRRFEISALIPVMLLFCTFFYYPFLKNIYYMFTDYNYLNTPTFVGCQNFKRFFGDSQALLALKNTFKITIFSVPIVICLSLVLAVLVDKLVIGKVFVRNAIFMTYLTPSIVAAIVFKVWFGTDSGVINSTLYKLGMQAVPWLTETKYAMVAVIVLAIWLKVGYYFVIFLAGVSNIDRNLHEAAKIDGANELQIFFKVTLPQLKPVTVFTTIMATISGLKAYAEVVVLTNGAPYDSTQTILMYMFQRGFRSRDVGYGTTIAFALFLIIFAVTLVQMRANKVLSSDAE